MGMVHERPPLSAYVLVFLFTALGVLAAAF